MLRPVYTTDHWCARGHFSEAQADKYAELCWTLQPKYVLEVGFCTGRSAASVLYNTRSCLKAMVSVDRDLDWKAPDGRLMARMLENRYGALKVVEMDSHDLLTPEFFQNSYPDGVDLVTLDGDHSYEGCTSDLESIAPYLSRHGLLVVDDYLSGPPAGVRIQSVTEGVDDFLARHHGEFQSEVWNCAGKGFSIIRRTRSR